MNFQLSNNDNFPAKPVLIFDGDCGFCLRWIGRWRRWVGDRLDYVPIEEAVRRFPSLWSQDLHGAIRLIDTEGVVHVGMDALCLSLAVKGRWYWKIPLWVYQTIPGAAFFGERIYHFIARNRHRFS